MTYPARTCGFTLIELSMVLVIIGLIVGGVMAGRELIRNAHIRKAITQQESFNTAVSTFTLKYNCLAGDCANAAQHGIGTASGYGVQGDGDGRILDTDEQSSFWYHLSHAGLIEWAAPASITGVETACTNGGLSTSPCLPFPSSSDGGINGGWWVLHGMDSAFSNNIGSIDISLKPSHYWWITGTVSNGGVGGASTLLPIEAYMIDSKLDDGLPLSGNIFPVSDLTEDPYGPTELLISFMFVYAPGDACVIEVSGQGGPRYNTSRDSRANGNLCSLMMKAGF